MLRGRVSHALRSKPSMRADDSCSAGNQRTLVTRKPQPPFAPIPVAQETEMLWHIESHNRRLPHIARITDKGSCRKTGGLGTEIFVFAWMDHAGLSEALCCFFAIWGNALPEYVVTRLRGSESRIVGPRGMQKGRNPSRTLVFLHESRLLAVSEIAFRLQIVSRCLEFTCASFAEPTPAVTTLARECRLIDRGRSVTTDRPCISTCRSSCS